MRSVTVYRFAALVIALVVIVPLAAYQVRWPGREKQGVLLHNGWRITPAGSHEKTGDMLLGCALSPDGSMLAMTNTGATAHRLHLVDPMTGRIRQSLPLVRGWSGLVWSPDSRTIYVAGGTSLAVYRFERQADGTFAPGEPIPLPGSSVRQAPSWFSGLALAPDGRTLYVADTGLDIVLSVSLPEGSVRVQRKLEAGVRPYALCYVANGGRPRLYVAQWAAGNLLALDPGTLETVQVLPVGNHPNAVLCVGSRLFVSCGNDDTVVVLDQSTGQVQERINMRLTPRAPAGATPAALAVAPDGKTLFVANSDNNCVAVVDVSRPGQSHVRGFIPTGWYPTAVAVSADGKRLFIGSGKGTGTGPNPVTKLPINPVVPTGYPYIVQLLNGLISTVPIPDAAQLAAYTRQTLANTPYRDAYVDRPRRAPRPGTNPIPSRLGDPSPIKYVLYIIKENRTYDQVLGDMKDHSGRPIGNGDPNLTLFGEEVTPNHHALAREFVLLDNLYCDGEVSVDGHHWSNGAYVPDFMQRTWPQQYSGRGIPPLNEALATTPAGRIWDLCERKGLSYRTYYYHTQKNRCEKWAQARAAGRRDYDYVDIFLEEFREFERTGTMPRFMIMALSEDHTRGTTPGAFTPKACVASNDLALGKIVETISRSRYWKEFAIFVIEDDAQNGPDHVDAHRTVGLVISPYTRLRKVDSTFYTTASFLRTMELILGLPPMSQYDAAATPLYNSFTSRPDLTPYTALPARVDLQAKNSRLSYGAQKSLALDFSEPDRLTLKDEDTLNRILWHSIKGERVPYPGVTRRAILHPSGRSLIAPEPDEEDED
ncbi:MAG: beta-propeller fold lactonase family protein [Chloroherpetonaceae bacterium]|nr:bifunctional YncE family protein/alkaline phosphatase family protein [Chthonomonadaceae bacterium]MDW8209347.1 beta-propeller fold lactonase family protein [Chloroherpetonaceae bacterium]